MVEGRSPGSPALGKLELGVRLFPGSNCHGEGDPGGGLGLARTGRAKGLCLSENPIVPPVRILHYGSGMTIGGVTCRAVTATIGVRCTNRSGHGFRMSAYGWARF